jgi:hypothetical protein
MLQGGLTQSWRLLASSNFVRGTASPTAAGAAIELAICLQNDLILLLRETRDAPRMLRNQIENFRNLAVQFFLGSIALPLLTLVFFWLEVGLASRKPSHHLRRDEQGE